jgi:two-component system C4-dicarboxylate transport response regulator DctD
VIEQALQECGGSIKQTMEYLNIARKTLYDKMQKHNINKALFKD